MANPSQRSKYERRNNGRLICNTNEILENRNNGKKRFGEIRSNVHRCCWDSIRRLSGTKKISNARDCSSCIALHALTTLSALVKPPHEQDCSCARMADGVSCNFDHKKHNPRAWYASKSCKLPDMLSQLVEHFGAR